MAESTAITHYALRDLTLLQWTECGELTDQSNIRIAKVYEIPSILAARNDSTDCPLCMREMQAMWDMFVRVREEAVAGGIEYGFIRDLDSTCYAAELKDGKVLRFAAIDEDKWSDDEIHHIMDRTNKEYMTKWVLTYINSLPVEVVAETTDRMNIALSLDDYEIEGQFWAHMYDLR